MSDNPDLEVVRHVCNPTVFVGQWGGHDIPLLWLSWRIGRSIYFLSPRNRMLRRSDVDVFIAVLDMKIVIVVTPEPVIVCFAFSYRSVFAVSQERSQRL